MRKYSTNLGFVDLLFNLLVGFVSLLLIAFLLINPIADEGKIDPKSEFLIILTWPDNSIMDIDLWVKGPTDNDVVSFKRKDANWMVLERDDLGISNDFVMVDGVPTKIRRNIETLSINAIAAGEYVVNVHHYNTTKKIHENEIYPVPVQVEIIKLNPYKVVYTGKVELTFRQEVTIATFLMSKEGDVSDIRTDIQIPLYYKSANTGGDVNITPTTRLPSSPSSTNSTRNDERNEYPSWEGTDWGGENP